MSLFRTALGRTVHRLPAESIRFSIVYCLHAVGGKPPDAEQAIAGVFYWSWHVRGNTTSLQRRPSLAAVLPTKLRPLVLSNVRCEAFHQVRPLPTSAGIQNTGRKTRKQRSSTEEQLNAGRKAERWGGPWWTTTDSKKSGRARKEQTIESPRILR